MALVHHPLGPEHGAPHRVPARPAPRRRRGTSTRAAWAVDLLLLHTSAFAAEQDNRRGDDEVALRRAQDALGSVSAEDHPHIHALGDDLFSGEQGRHDWALDVLINGVLSTPRP